MENKRNNLIFYFSLVISMIIWGANWPAGKIVSVYGNSIDIVFVRYVIVVISFIPILFFINIPWKEVLKFWHFAFMAAIVLSVFSYAFIKGLKLGFAGAGGVLVTTLNPIFSFSLSIIINNIRLSKTKIIGLLFGLVAGCILLKVWTNLDHIFTPENSLFLLASFSWAVLGKLSTKTTSVNGAIGFSFLMYFFTAIILGMILDYNSTKTMIQHSDHIFWLGMLFNALVSTTLATTIFFYANSKLGSAQASSFIFIVPSSAALVAFLLLGENIEWNTILGGFLGMIAVYLLNKKEKIVETT